MHSLRLIACLLIGFLALASAYWAGWVRAYQKEKK